MWRMQSASRRSISRQGETKLSDRSVVAPYRFIHDRSGVKVIWLELRPLATILRGRLEERERGRERETVCLEQQMWCVFAIYITH